MLFAYSDFLDIFIINILLFPGEQIFWECMQRVMWQMAEQMGHNVTRETRDYLDRLLQIAVDSIDTQFPRIRKEYRMMPDAERDRFHKAILALKEDTVRAMLCLCVL